MTPHIEFGSNVDTLDLIPMIVDHLDELPDVVHLNLGHARDNPEPNSYPRFVEHNIFRRLKESGRKVVLEAPALKNWKRPGACNGEVMRDAMREGDQNVRAAGGEIWAYEFDEPLTASPTCPGQTFDEAIGITATAIREMADIGIRSHLIEAYPRNSAQRLIDFVKGLVDLGRPPQRFAWDINDHDFPKQGRWARWRGRPHGLTDPAVHREMRSTAAAFHSLGLENELIVVGWPGRTDAEYRQSTLAFNDQIRLIWGHFDIDVITVRNWSEEGGVLGLRRSQPNNLPVDDPTSHLGILQTVRETWT